ncbi:MAG: hypothetical protein M1608_11725 [Candidatus Omnitrophica bacterium]|nr:hypothetical protein [Candidatus Omnitrophota bacterium]
MKNSLPIAGALIALLLSACPAMGQAQETVPPQPPSAPAAPPSPALPAPPPPPASVMPSTFKINTTGTAVSGGGAAFGVLGGAAIGGVTVPSLKSLASGLLGGSTNSALVVQVTPLPIKTIDNLQEDMTIMLRILDDALAQRFSREEIPTAMNIPIYVLGGTPSIRGFYLEDYGAMFILNARFPLVPPPNPAPETSKSPTSSTWDQTKQELYGAPETPAGATPAPPAPPEGFNEGKVRQLKDTVIEALKEATNIRNLKPDDAIVVAVVATVGKSTRIGYGITPEMMRHYGLDPRLAILNQPPIQANSVLTIRVMKSDVDAFAQGKLSLDDFRSKASIFAY